MLVFRLSKAAWTATALSGEGAMRYAGRWHFAGTPLVYTASSRSLAALELLVHMEVRHAPPSLVLLPITVPDELVAVLDAPPPGWDALPAGDASRRVGSAWARSRSSLALAVPSVVVRGERNVLLNPRHSAFGRIEVGEAEPFAFDPRLLER